MLFTLVPYLLQARYYRDSDGLSWISTVLIIVIVLVMVRALIVGSREIQPIAHWHYHFDNFTYSSQEFYTAVAKTVQAKGIPGVSMEKKSYSEGGLLSANREYLKIVRKRQVFTICAAPFGNGFFISWWHHETRNPNQKLIAAIPYIGLAIVKALQMKTFFEIDTELMYKEAIRYSVLDVTKSITEEKGIRGLAEMERNSRETTQISADAL